MKIIGGKQRFIEVHITGPESRSIAVNPKMIAMFFLYQGHLHIVTTAPDGEIAVEETYDEFVHALQQSEEG